MGEVIDLRIEMSKEDFLARWKQECEEWQAIKDKLLKEHPDVPLFAADVSEEQQYLADQRGEELLDVKRIYIIGEGWLIPR